MGSSPQTVVENTCYCLTVSACYTVSNWRDRCYLGYTSGKSRRVFVKKFSEVRDNCATIDRRKFIVSNGSRNKDSHPYRKRHGIIHSADICLRLCALLARVYFPEKLPSDTASRFIPLFGFHENFSEDLSRVFLIFHRIRNDKMTH